MHLPDDLVRIKKQLSLFFSVQFHSSAQKKVCQRLPGYKDHKYSFTHSKTFQHLVIKRPKLPHHFYITVTALPAAKRKKKKTKQARLFFKKALNDEKHLSHLKIFILIFVGKEWITLLEPGLTAALVQ